MEMAWLSKNIGEDKQLYLREAPDKPWKVYTESSYKVPDYLIKGGSKGYATMQVLFQRGWKLVSTDCVVLES